MATGLEIKTPPLCCLVHGEMDRPRCLNCGATICPQCRTIYHIMEERRIQVTEHFYDGICRIRPDKEIRILVERKWVDTLRLREEKNRLVQEQMYEQAAKTRDEEINTF